MSQASTKQTRLIIQFEPGMYAACSGGPCCHVSDYTRAFDFTPYNKQQREMKLQDCRTVYPKSCLAVLTIDTNFKLETL